MGKQSVLSYLQVECCWNLMAHGDVPEGKWVGNWRMEWVARNLTLPRNVVYTALLTLMRTPRLPVVDWTDAPADLNGLVRFGERRNVVSVRVPLRFKRTLLYGSLRGYTDKISWEMLWREWVSQKRSEPSTSLLQYETEETNVSNTGNKLK
jgi:hypothetical protein